jgi:DUF917 family protein
MRTNRGPMVGQEGTRYLTLDDVTDMAHGTAVLGSGGGGAARTVLLQLETILADGRQIALIDLAAVPDDALVAPCGWMGAPTVSEEKLPNGGEAGRGLAKLEEIKGQRVFAVFPLEIGGSNGLSPLLLAAERGIPVVDCDGMGRAFPEAQMVVFNVYGCSANPVIVTDEKGNCVVLEAASNAEEERITRVLSIAMGGSCHVIDYAGSGYQMKQHAVRGTVSLAIAVGRAVRLARSAGRDPFEALTACLRASNYYRFGGVLFDGKIVDLERNTAGGFAVGRAILESFGLAERIEVEFQNENLVARKNGQIVASVPDILTFVDRETAEPVTTERLRYGQRLKLLGISVPPILRTAQALAVFGPAVFGIAEQYRPIEDINGWL